MNKIKKKTKATILNVDDNEVGLYATSQILRQADFNVLEAKTGSEALDLVKQKPDLVVLDVHLPDISGFEVCKKIRANPDTALIPVLHISATYVDTEAKVKGLTLGADGYLTQPMEPIVLIATIKALLRMRQAEDEVISAAHQLQTTFDAVINGMCLLDSEGQIVRHNKALSTILEQPAQDFTGENYWEVIYGTKRPIRGCPFTRMKSSHQREDLLWKTGERWLEISVNPLQNEAGELEGGVYIISDVTKRIQSEEALINDSVRLEAMVKERTRDLEHIQEKMIQQEKMAAIGTLAGGIGHELRHPLGVILNSAYFLQLSLPDADETTKEYLKLIETEVRASDRIISDLLNFAQSQKAEREEVVVSDLIEQSLENISPPDNIQIRKELADDLPLLYIDPLQIKLVLVNLATNAYQAMPKGGELNIEALEENGGVTISVRDTGCGISKENLKKLFEPLFTTKTRGIGLGLAVSKTLVEANHGSIEVESDEGKGTTFRVIFPSEVVPS